MNLLQHINELHLEVTPQCNLKCSYCFMGYLPSENNNFHFMSRKTAEMAIEKVSTNTNSKRVLLTFHGGEPMLQKAEWFDSICTGANRLSEKNGIQINFAMQSNGSLLTESLLKILIKHNVQVGISLDGLEKQHNAIRGQYRQTILNAIKLKDHNLLGGFITVLTSVNHKNIKPFLLYLSEEGFRKVSLNELYANGRGTNEYTLSVDQLFSVWKETLDFMLDNYNNGVCDRLTLYRVSRFLNPPDKRFFRSHLNCNNPFCHAGIKMIHLSADGDIFPCGSSAWSDFENYRLGNISFEIDQDHWTSTVQTLQLKPKEYTTDCHICNASQICSFGCSAFDKIDPIGKANMCGATKLLYKYLKTRDSKKLSNLLKSTEDLKIKNVEEKL